MNETTDRSNEHATGDVMAAMRADIHKDEELTRVKKRVVALLAKLPDDEARRRVIAEAAISLGFKAP